MPSVALSRKTCQRRAGESEGKEAGVLATGGEGGAHGDGPSQEGGAMFQIHPRPTHTHTLTLQPTSVCLTLPSTHAFTLLYANLIPIHMVISPFPISPILHLPLISS